MNQRGIIHLEPNGLIKFNGKTYEFIPRLNRRDSTAIQHNRNYEAYSLDWRGELKVKIPAAKHPIHRQMMDVLTHRNTAPQPFEEIWTEKKFNE